MLTHYNKDMEIPKNPTEVEQSRRRRWGLEVNERAKEKETKNVTSLTTSTREREFQSE